MSLSFFHRHQIQRSLLTATVLSLGLTTACGTPSSPTESSPTATVASKGAAPDQDLARLAFEGEVRFKPAGNHTNRFTITVGNQDHPFGHGFVLMIKEAIVMGDCLKTTVYDFGTNTYQVEVHGTPSCAPPDQPARTMVSQEQSAFKEKLEEILTLVNKVQESNLVAKNDQAKLTPVREYLSTLRRVR